MKHTVRIHGLAVTQYFKASFPVITTTTTTTNTNTTTTITTSYYYYYYYYDYSPATMTITVKHIPLPNTTSVKQGVHKGKEHSTAHTHN